MTTIRIPLELDQNQDGKVSFSELVSATKWIMFYSFLGLNALSIGLVGIGLVVGAITPSLNLIRGILAFAIFAGGLSIIGGVGLGIWRMVRYERYEREAMIELKRRRDCEDADRNGIRQEKKPGTRYTQSEVDRSARIYLRHYFETGILARGKIPGLSKDMWDIVNGLMKSRGIRHGKDRRLEYATFNEAWGKYVDGSSGYAHWTRKGEEFIDSE